jgi:YVTN family beta-propeller protein
MDIMSDGKTILLASRWAQKLTVIDMSTRQVVRQIKVGKSPHGVWTLDHAPRQCHFEQLSDPDLSGCTLVQCAFVGLGCRASKKSATMPKAHLPDL